jgi:GNAT superfamily N-acetyltransferase
MNKYAEIESPRRFGERSTSENGDVAIAHLLDADLPAVTRLLDPTLSNLYPNGRLWLRRRLIDVLAGDAVALVAHGADAAVGAAILTPKPGHGMKLSTIYVSDCARSHGVGTHLLSSAVQLADDARVAELWVTVAHHIAPELSPLLEREGFTETAYESNRYGLGRHEIVYTRLA